MDEPFDPKAERSPELDEPASRISTAGSMLIVVGAMGMGLVGMLVIPKFVEIFADFDTELPVVSQLIVSIPPVAWGLGAVIVSALVLAKDFFIADAEARMMTNLVAGVLVIGLMMTTVVALFLPMIKLIQSVTV